MSKHFFIFIIFIFCLIESNLFGQDIILYKETKTLSYDFKYQPDKDENSLPNYFITQFCISQNKIRSYFKYTYSVDVNCQIVSNNNSYKLIITFKNEKCNGDFEYKGFDFSKAIIPNSTKFEFGMQYLTSNKISKNQISINTDTNFVFNSVDSIKIINDKLVLKYANYQKEEFETLINYINTYKNEGEIINQIKLDLDKIDTLDLNNTTLNNIDIKYIKKKFEKLTINSFASDLKLQTTDPDKFYASYLNLKNIISEKETSLNKRSANLDSLYLIDGINYLKTNEETRAEDCFKKSLQINKDYIPSLFQLASLYNYQKKYLNSVEYLNEILNLTRTNKLSNKLANEVYANMLDSAQKLNYYENYNSSLNILNNAKTFYTKNSNIILSNLNQEELLKNAYYGMYLSYISIAEASFRKNRLDMSEEYLKTAFEYQKTNKEYIKNNNETSPLLNLLVTQYLRISIENKQNYNYNIAEKYFNHADSLANYYKSNQAMNFVEAAKNNVLKPTNTNQISYNYSNQESQKNIPSKKEETPYESYKSHFDKGYIYITYWRFNLAYNEFKKVKKLELENNFKPIDSLNSYLQRSGTEVIVKILKDANLQAWSGKYTDANKTLNTALTEMQNIDTVNNTAIRLSLKALKENLQKENLAKESNKFNKLMQVAAQNIDLKDFISLETACLKAINIKTQNPNLNVDEKYPISLLQKYEAPINYQKGISNANLLYESNNCTSSINTVYNSDSIYTTQNLKTYNIAREDITSFLSKKDNSKIYEEAIKFNLNKNKSEEIYKILKQSEKNQLILNSEILKLSMQSIGKQDSTDNKNTKENFNSRFGKSKTFIKYKKYYLKPFK